MMRTARWIGAAVVGGLLLSASPAGAVDWRWPWEKPKDKKEKKEKPETPPLERQRGTKFTGRPEDREMLPRLARFYGEQLDLADRAVSDARDPEVKAFGRRLQRQSERALGVVNEQARSVGLDLKPHVRASLAEKVRQSGRLGRTRQRAKTMTDLEILRGVMENIEEIRPEFAEYKEGSDPETAKKLGRLFDDELVPNYDEAKALHDRVRNETR